MDQRSYQIICSKHNEEQIKWVKANEIEQDQPIFYCDQCEDQDDDFQKNHFFLFNNILKLNDNTVIKCLPIVQDKSLLSKFYSKNMSNTNIDEIIKKIELFFDEFQNQIKKKLEDLKKLTIQKVNLNNEKNKEIVTQHQNICGLKDLKNIMSDQNSNNLEKEQRYRQFIQQLQDQKQQNTEQLEYLLNPYQRNQDYIDYTIPNKIQSNVYKLIDSINLCHLDNINPLNANDGNQNNNNNNNVNQQNRIKSEQILKLISNKSNYCSQTFLDSISNMLNEITPILDRISFDNAFIPNKLPINFNDLKENQLSLIDEMAKHLTTCQKDQEYLHNTKESNQIKEIISIFQLQPVSLNNQFIEQYEKCLIDVYPFLKQINFNNIYTNQNNLQLIQQLPQQKYNELLMLIQRSRELQQNDNFKNSNSYLIINQLKYYDIYFNLAYQEEILKSYPIFDIQLKQQINIIQDLQIITCMDGQQFMNITKNENNHITLKYNRNNVWVNNISNFILESNRLYVFRFQISNNSQNQKHVMLGLIKDATKDNTYGYTDYLSCYFVINENQKIWQTSFGMLKSIKGNFNSLQEINMLEMRVCINQGQIDMLDYPGYNHHLAIDDQYIPNLKSFQDLRLYIGMYESNIDVTLTDAFYFNN